MLDFVEIDCFEKKQTSSPVNYKSAIFIFILYICINSDIFIDRVLYRIPHATSGNSATNYGIVVSGLILSLLFICLDFLVKNNIV